MSETTNNNISAAAENGAAPTIWPDISGIPTTPVAPSGGTPVYPGEDLSGVPTTPIAPTGSAPVITLDELAGIPTTPIAPTGGRPVYPGGDSGDGSSSGGAQHGPHHGMHPGMRPGYPGNGAWPNFPAFSFPTQTLPTITYYGQVRFMNATTNGLTLDVYIDGQNIFSGSTFATVSAYIQVSDGFHTVTIRQTNGQILYRQSIAFVAGEKATMVLLDTANGVTLTKVSDMGCSNLPSGYGCMRVANMAYSGISYDVRMFNNQVVFSGIGYKEVTSFKQAAAGNYTFFITAAQSSVSTLSELPVLIVSALVGGCANCTVSNPILTYSVNVQAGKTYTSYIIGNPWSNLYRVYTLED